MKKTYINPTVSFEGIENDVVILTDSKGNATWDLGGGEGEDNRKDKDIDLIDGGESI